MELAQKDQLLEIRSRARLGKPIIGKGLSVPCDKSQLYSHEVRTNLLFTMSNRTGAEPRGSTQTLFRMTFFTISTLHAPSSQKMVGGAGRDRTDDILLAKQALSQLSYGP